MRGGDRTSARLILIGLLFYAFIYWSMQPACSDAEVRVRGVFMTYCVAGR